MLTIIKRHYGKIILATLALIVLWTIWGIISAWQVPLDQRIQNFASDKITVPVQVDKDGGVELPNDGKSFQFQHPEFGRIDIEVISGAELKSETFEFMLTRQTDQLSGHFMCSKPRATGAIFVRDMQCHGKWGDRVDVKLPNRVTVTPTNGFRYNGSPVSTATTSSKDLFNGLGKTPAPAAPATK